MGRRMMSQIFFPFCASLLLFVTPSYADLDCVACHGPNGPHGEGFEGCNACHGYPPLTNVAGSDGLVKYPSATGSVSPGAHARHATASGYSYPCQTCHYGGMTAQSGIVQDPRQLEIGFNIFGTGGGVYNGRALLAPYTYTAGHGTLVTTTGAMTCSSIYCHSDGTSVSTEKIASFLSPAWTSQEPLACSACHGYPPAYEQDEPKSNGHFKHGHQTHPCSDCHYATTSDGQQITDVTRHVNGRYDVVADPTVGNSFVYTWAKGGGTCNNVSCHGLPHQDGAVWGDEFCVYRITSSPGANCFERTFTLVPGQYNTCVLPGVSYQWDFGDGQTSTEAEPSHIYAAAGTYTVRVNFMDAGNHPGSALTSVVVQSGNMLPVTDASIAISGYTAALTDLSYDPDYDQCGHSGPGKIVILWGNLNARTEQAIDLTDTPSNQIFSYTYPARAGIYLVSHYVSDNATTTLSLSSKTQIKLPAPADGINISGRLTRLTDGAPVWNKIMWLKVNGVNSLYATTNPQGYYHFFGVAPGCYTVAPQAITGATFSPVVSAPVCAENSAVDFTITP